MITDIEVAELLKTYGDALTETHPASHTADDFTTSAAQTRPLLTNNTTGATDPLDNIVEIAHQPRHRGRRALAAAAIVLLAGLAAFGAWTGLRATETVSTTGVPDGVEAITDIPVELQPFVFPGEIVLRTNPLVVIAAPPTELNFDTSDLGTEIVFGRISELDQDDLDRQIDDSIEGLLVGGFGGDDPTIRKITLRWENDDGFGNEPTLAILAVVDSRIDEDMADRFGLDPVGSLFRSTFSGIGSDGDFVDNPDDPESFRLPATVEEHLNIADAQGRYPVARGAGSGGGSFDLFYEVAREVAVVQMIHEDTSVWMKPIAGYVVLSGEGSINDRIELVTYNADGEELTRRLATVQDG